MEDGHRITDEYLKHALASKYEVHPKDVTIKKFDVTGGSNKGDNFACEMKAVTVESDIRGKTQSDSFMAKCFPMNEARCKWLRQALIFRIEVIWYTDILHRLNAYAGAEQKNHITSPTCYFADSEKGIMIMENLKTQGYVIQDKSKGLDMAHLKSVLVQLARIHGLSYHMIENYEGGLDRFKKDYWFMTSQSWFNQESQEMKEMMTMMFDSTFGNYLAVLDKFLDDRSLLTKVQEFNKIRAEKVEAVHAPKEGGFNTLLHNDAWCNNFMFKNDANGNPLDIQVIDLQLVRRGRPTVDLAYLLGSSTTPEFRKEHIEEILSFYHHALIDVLGGLGYSAELYPYNQLKKDYDECFVFGFVMGTMHAMLSLIPQGSDAAMDSDKMGTDPEDMQKVLAEMLAALLLEAEKNEALTQRLIAQAEEAHRMNIL